jgi:hypothetical protein
LPQELATLLKHYAEFLDSSQEHVFAHLIQDPAITEIRRQDSARCTDPGTHVVFVVDELLHRALPEPTQQLGP